MFKEPMVMVVLYFCTLYSAEESQYPCVFVRSAACLKGEGTPGVIMLNFHLSTLPIWEDVFRENEPPTPAHMTPVLLRHIIIALQLCGECGFVCPGRSQSV